MVTRATGLDVNGDAAGPLGCGCYRVEVADYGHRGTCALRWLPRPDDALIAVRLTRREWREIRTVIGRLTSGPQDVLWDRLDAMHLDAEANR